MSSTDFTFLNTTGMPGISQLAAKLMRVHINKTNFEKRRQRIADAKTAEQKLSGITVDGEDQHLVKRSLSSGLNSKAGLNSAMQPRDLYSHARFLARYWSLVLPESRDYPEKPNDTAWIEFLVSEPALFESIIAIGIRHRSSDILFQQLAEVHASKAFNAVIQRIDSGKAYTDSVLGAVLTMALGERLMHNDLVWDIHMQGLAQLIQQRYSQGASALPLWFRNLILLDSINSVLNFPRFYHQKVVEAISAYDDQSFLQVVNLSASIIHLRNSIDAYHKYQLDSGFMIRKIEEPSRILFGQAEALQTDDDPAVQATSKAFKLLLCLSRRPYTRENLMPIVVELKEALCGIQVMPCSYVDLTSCQLMIGAVAADKDSQTRAWFMTRLKNAVEALRSRGWDNPLDILRKGFVVDPSLIIRHACQISKILKSSLEHERIATIGLDDIWTSAREAELFHDAVLKLDQTPRDEVVKAKSSIDMNQSHDWKFVHGCGKRDVFFRARFQQSQPGDLFCPEWLKFQSL